MARGSRPGERRGGRQKGTPNRVKTKVDFLSTISVYEQLISSIKTGSAYVYGHYFGATCFYIGKGNAGRAWNASSRNDKWLEYVQRLKDAGVKYDIRIIAGNLSDDEALAIEEALIRVNSPACNILLREENTGQMSIAI